MARETHTIESLNSHFSEIQEALANRYEEHAFRTSSVCSYIQLKDGNSFFADFKRQYQANRFYDQMYEIADLIVEYTANRWVEPCPDDYIWWTQDFGWETHDDYEGWEEKYAF